MSRMDLIPAEFRLGRQRRRRLRFWLVAVMAILLVGGLWCGVDYVFYLQENTASRYINDQYRLLKDKIDDCRKRNEQLTAAETRADAWMAMSQYLDIAAAMDFLLRHTDASVYFTRISFCRDESKPEPSSAAMAASVPVGMFNVKPEAKSPSLVPELVSHEIKVTLQGCAVDHQAVADFLDLIHRSDYFQKVTLINTQRKLMPDYEAVEFEVDGVAAQKRHVPEVQYARMPKTKDL